MYARTGEGNNAMRCANGILGQHVLRAASPPGRALTKRDTVSSRKGKRATISARSHDVSDLILEHFLCPGRNLMPRCKGLGRFYDSLFRRAAGLEDPLEWVFMFFLSSLFTFHLPPVYLLAGIVPFLCQPCTPQQKFVRR